MLECLANHGVSPNECRLSNVTTGAYKKASSAPRRSRVGVLCAILIAFSMLSGVSAAPITGNVTDCKTFSPGPQDNWDTNARTWRQELTTLPGGFNCTEALAHGSPSCRFGIDSGNTLPFGIEWATPPLISVQTDEKSLVDTVNKALGKEYTETISVDLFAGEDNWSWAVPAGSAIAINVSASAVKIPGTISDCEDDKTYEGSVLIPGPYEFWYTIEPAKGPAWAS